jgi:hypothetical protein
VIPFFAFPPAIRRVIYTTNALESVHARLRKIIKTRGHFPHDEAATKLIWLALRNITAGWWKAANYWHLAMNQAHGRCVAHTHYRLNALHTKNLTLPRSSVPVASVPVASVVSVPEKDPPFVLRSLRSSV